MAQNTPDQNYPPYENSQNSESEKISSASSFLKSGFGRNLKTSTPENREKLFYVWYNNGRPGVKDFYKILVKELPEFELPAESIISILIPEFKDRAIELDMQVHEQLTAMVVAEKVEMLKRHATIGFKIQDIALEYIENHKDEITPSGAIRLLVEGVRIERESRGIPEALDKMSRMSDDELLDEVKSLLSSTSVTLEDIDADN